jgi:hypothetical protein
LHSSAAATAVASTGLRSLLATDLIAEVQKLLSNVDEVSREKLNKSRNGIPHG